jgi:hypothetical protein
MATKNEVLALQAIHDDHKNVIIITENFDIEDEQEEAQPELQLSMHVLCGIRSHIDTFTISIQMGQYYAIAIVDTGSTTTFMTPQFATMTVFHTIPAKRMEVAVANGQRLWTDIKCLNCPYTIQGTMLHLTSESCSSKAMISYWDRIGSSNTALLLWTTRR